MTKSRTLAQTLHRWSLPLLLVVLALAYLPSLGGGYLNWDDPWLVQDNARLHRASAADFVAAWTDLSFDTRMQFGAEYLPVRDTSLLIESRLIGLTPGGLRLVNLAAYLAAVVLLRRALRAVCRDDWGAEIVTWLFALHPVHVESVAWIAGRKDVLALLFVAAALDAYARRGRLHVLWTALWFALAMLSKSMSIAAVGLLPLLDLLASRRIGYRAVAASTAVVLVLMPLHLIVGRTVGMTTALAGGSRTGAIATMGPVWARYLACLVWPGELSIVQDVPSRASFDVPSVGGYALLAAWAVAAAVLWWRRNSRTLGIALLAFLIPLAPVSQIFFALQNRMADRYLWLSVLAPALVIASVRRRYRIGGVLVALAFGGLWLGATAVRANLFASSVRVFLDATRKTTMSTMAPYQLGQAYEAQGDDADAIGAYEETWQRFQATIREHPLDASREAEPARRATNNLAKLLARRGHWEAAEQVLRRGLVYFGADAKMRDNLQRVLAHRAGERSSPEQ